MNNFDTLLFPNALIFKARIFPLLLFSNPLHYLQPAEGNLLEHTGDESSSFLNTGFFKAHTPAPLDGDRDKFLKALDNIKDSKKEQLLDLFGSNQEDLSLKSDLLYSHLEINENELTANTAECELWKARLIIVIAEMLDIEKDELREQLFSIMEDEAAVIDAIRENDNQHADSLLDSIKKLGKQLDEHHFKNNRLRFNAWIQLLRNKPIPPVKIWLTTTRDDAEPVFQRYHDASGESAVPLLKLDIPAHFSESGKYITERIKKFHRLTETIHQGLVSDFDRITMTRDYDKDSVHSLLPFNTDWAAQWEAVVYELFPTSSYGRNSITFYLLPHQPLEKLFALEAPDSNQREVEYHGLLGVVNNTSSL